MNPLGLLHLRDRLNEAMGPGKRWAIGGGVRWDVIDPRLGSLRERVYFSRNEASGIIWRSGAREYRKRPEGSYQATARLTLSVYFASMEQFAYEGEYLLIEDALLDVLPTVADPAHGIEHAWLDQIEDMTLQDDQYGEVLIVAAQVDVRYVTQVRAEDLPTIQSLVWQLRHDPIPER